MLLFSVLGNTNFIEVITLAVDADDSREILNLVSADSFRSQVLVSNHGFALNGLGDYRSSTAYSDEINSAMLHAGINNLLTAQAFADHAAHALLNHGRGVFVHTAASGGACTADNLARFGRRRTNVINNIIGQIQRQLFAALQRFIQTLVSSVACSVDITADAYNVACMQVFDSFFIFSDPPSDTMRFSAFRY